MENTHTHHLDVRMVNATVTLHPSEHLCDDHDMYERYIASLLAHTRLISREFKLWAEYTANDVLHFHLCAYVDKPKAYSDFYRRVSGTAGFAEIKSVKKTIPDYTNSWNYDTKDKSPYEHAHLPRVLTELYFPKDVRAAAKLRAGPIVVKPPPEILSYF